MASQDCDGLVIVQLVAFVVFMHFADGCEVEQSTFWLCAWVA